MVNGPIFAIGPSGSAQLHTAWHTKITQFCVGIETAVGSHAKVHLRPYRLGQTGYLALDLKGDTGEVSITIIEGTSSKLSNTSSISCSNEIECEVMDMIDAYYLAAIVLMSLGLSWPGLPISFSGPKTIAS